MKSFEYENMLYKQHEKVFKTKLHQILKKTVDSGL